FFLSMIRLSFLLAPVASAEHRTRLSRAWALTHGSTLRIFIVVLGVFLPMVVAAGIAGYYLLGPADVSAFYQSLLHAKHGAPLPVHDFLAAHAAMLSILSAVFAVLDGALLAGASA